ncbi:MAG: hypothetical protein RL160_1005 [Bacteroidota bacterium]|jgi:hypothetical protein
MSWAEPNHKLGCFVAMKNETGAVRLEFIKAATADVRKEITGHPLYSRIVTLQGIQRMMEHHVYAVWDFMSLLKALQAKLTCVHVPWFPQGNADTRFFINEIVLGEESDVDPSGGHISHYELYLKAMKQAGADTSGIERFLESLRSGANLESAFEVAHTPDEVRDFVRYTLDVATHAPVHVLAAVFTFGREDLIPDMFMELIREIKSKHPKQLDLFNYYLERHIEVDGDHHGPLSWNMVQALCGEDDARWQEAATASVQALQHRKALWDAVLTRL